MVERVDGAANELIGNGDSATMHQTGASLSVATDSSRNELAALQMQLFGLKRYLTGMTDKILRLRTEMQRENAKLLAVTRRIAAQPVVRSRPKNVANQNVPARSECSDQSGNQSGHQQVARLSKRPRDLYESWHEYEFGYCGFKPAKQFTASERGACKSIYCRRKRFWDVVGRLVRAGYTSDAAIDNVYTVCGRQRAVTDILEALRVDKKSGHLSLRV
ncbi:unnamed protein product [Phytophthora lilii]|uniref:Unnamed protein product n=1 Tax=Phytophthora lilii TaxID=2077276 RepID=A0A9W6U5H5_9STRA|nr:unnamed protein product [Phytophthora lilii]